MLPIQNMLRPSASHKKKKKKKNLVKFLEISVLGPKKCPSFEGSTVEPLQPFSVPNFAKIEGRLIYYYNR